MDVIIIQRVLFAVIKFFHNKHQSQLLIKLIRQQSTEMNSTFNRSHHHILLSIKANQVIINAKGSKYEVLRQAANKLNYSLSEDLYNLLWTDFPLSIREIKAQSQKTKINHFPEITQITRKNKMAINLNTMKNHFPKDYNFYPETWLLPCDYQKMIKKHVKGKIYIVKPQNGCQGQGIYLLDSPYKLEKERNQVVQQYVQNPLLINDLKFDMRIYVLVTCIQPLRVYIYNDGIVRFATEKFQKPRDQNLHNFYSHLTNYAINKQNSKFQVDDNNFNCGHKRLITSVFKNEEYKQLMNKVSEIVIKTLIAGLATMQNAYQQCKRTDPNSCFQLLGFDILLNDKKQPILLQVNQNPSLSTETNLDLKLKLQMVKTILQMVTGGYTHTFQQKLQMKIKLKDRHEHAYRGNFRKIYPCESLEETQFYDQFMAKGTAIFRQKFGINIVRSMKKTKEIYRSQQEQMISWNQNPLRYNQQRVQRVYAARTAKTSLYKKRLIFI